MATFFSSLQLLAPLCVEPRRMYPPIFEPELNVLLLQTGELLPVGLRVEVLRVARDQGLRGVRVHHEPLLEPRYLRHCGAYHVATLQKAGWAGESPDMHLNSLI